MTLGNAKDKVLALLDETRESAGGIRLLKRMNMLFDMAQMEASHRAPIIKAQNITITKSIYALSDDVYRVVALIQNGRRMPFSSTGLDVFADNGEYIMEYIANPMPITNVTPDESEFEVDDIAAATLPYYVAAFCCLPDDTERYTHFMSMFEDKLEDFADAVRLRLI